MILTVSNWAPNCEITLSSINYAKADLSGRHARISRAFVYPTCQRIYSVQLKQVGISLWRGKGTAGLCLVCLHGKTIVEAIKCRYNKNAAAERVGKTDRQRDTYSRLGFLPHRHLENWKIPGFRFLFFQFWPTLRLKKQPNLCRKVGRRYKMKNRNAKHARCPPSPLQN